MLKNNQNFINELNRLKSLAKNPAEFGSINPDSASPTPVVGTTPDKFGQSEINIFDPKFNFLNNPITGFIHTHNSYAESIFSISDINALGWLADQGHIGNGEDFIFGLTTGRGTTYSLIIQDINVFNTFYQNHLKELHDFQSLEMSYYDSRAQLLNTVEGITFEKASELEFLNVIRDSGLILVKQRSNNKWQKLDRPDENDTNLKRKKCN